MATRDRPRPPAEDVQSDDEFGLVTDADIDAYLADQAYESEAEAEAEASSGFLNLQTGSGLGLIALGVLYSLQQIGLFGLGSTLLSDLVQVLPVLAAVLIMLTGFGVLSWSPAARRRRKARERAAKLRRQERKTMGRGASSRTTAGRGGAGRSSADERAAKAFGAAERALREAGRLAGKAGEAAGRASRAQAARSRAGAKLSRDMRRRKLTGVAAGMAAYFGLDPTVVRIAWVVATIFSQGGALLPYFILSMVLPKDAGTSDPVVRVTDD